MRDVLAKYPKRKVFVKAVVSRFGYFTSNSFSKTLGNFDTILLLDVNVTVADEELHLNHIWVTYDANFKKNNVQRGSIVEFSAYIYEYSKGSITIHPRRSRKNHSSKIQRWSTVENNFGIRRVRDLVVTGFTYTLPEEIIIDNGKRKHRNKYS